MFFLSRFYSSWQQLQAVFPSGPSPVRRSREAHSRPLRVAQYEPIQHQAPESHSSPLRAPPYLQLL